MALYIAIIDDDPASRKQYERLLKREADVRTAKGEVLYIDTFGDEEAALPCIRKYDLLFIDISKAEQDGMTIAANLRKKGIAALIVLCSEKIDYEEKYGRSNDFLYHKCPLWQRDFSHYIDLAAEAKKTRPKYLELRNETDTIYVQPDEILYARQEGGYMNITLTNSRSFSFLGSTSKFEDILGTCEPVFLETAKDTVLNMRYVISHSHNSFKMSDGAIINYSFFNKSFIMRAWKRYNEYIFSKKFS
ncbi:MAG: response regulator [Lachnospiraceae bacterium]|nr:response regulator [Lachnospiraceae bacterium]